MLNGSRYWLVSNLHYFGRMLFKTLESRLTKFTYCINILTSFKWEKNSIFENVNLFLEIPSVRKKYDLLERKHCDR